LVEQLTCNQQVTGSNPVAGSLLESGRISLIRCAASSCFGNVFVIFLICCETTGPTMLLEVDNRPIRLGYTARLRRARRAITRLEKQIARYDQVDAHAFYLWYHCEFGPILAHHRGLREKIAALEFTQSSPDSEHQEGINNAAQTAENSPADDQEAHEYRRDLGESNGRSGTESPGRKCRRLFRQIALQLHPDRGGPLVGERKLWWLQAQSAYESGDVVALKLIFSRCAPPRRTVAMSCAEIMQAIQEARNRAEALLSLRTRLRREPAWRFTAKSDQTRASLRIRLARELARIERALIDRLGQLTPTPDVWIEEGETV
jgi:hypothetical protein